MNAATVLRGITRTIGTGAPAAAAHTYLPVPRCKQCQAAVVLDRWQRWTRDACPPPPAKCEECRTPIGRLAPRGLCAQCLTRALAEEAARATVPHLHERARFGSRELAAWCRDVEAIDRAHAFAEAPPPGCRVLLFTGPTTAGKSSLVAAVVQHLKAAGRCRRLAWLDAKRLAQTRKEHPLGAGEPPTLTRALGADVCVIDDLGKELVFPAAEAAEVVTFLERRHAGERRLVPPGALDIITTELPVQLAPEEAAARELAGETPRDLTRCYDLSFVRRITGRMIGTDVVRGSAVVIHVRKGP